MKRLRPAFVFRTFQHTGPGIEELIDLRAFAHDFYARIRGEEEVEAPLRVAV